MFCIAVHLTSFMQLFSMQLTNIVRIAQKQKTVSAQRLHKNKDWCYYI